MVILTTLGDVCTHQSVLVPGHASLLVGIGVGVALGRTGLAAEQTVQVGADLVGTTSLDGVALSTAGLEKLGALRRVTWSEERISWLWWLGGGCWWLLRLLVRQLLSQEARFLFGPLLVGCTQLVYLLHEDGSHRAEDVEGAHGGGCAVVGIGEWRGWNRCRVERECEGGERGEE